MSEPILISSWEELAVVEDSTTHRLEIEPYECCGWVVDKSTEQFVYYLSTHTFYRRNYCIIPAKLKSYGFNIRLKNWDDKK